MICFLNFKPWIFVVASLFIFKAHAQLSFCQGNSGDPIFTEDFGTAPSTSVQYIPLPSGTTSYNYQAGLIGDGSYHVTNTTNDWGTYDWFQIGDHTQGDVNGRMLVVNADFTPGEFYRIPITGLCENTTYEFSSWMVNLTPSDSPLIATRGNPKPNNVRFEILDASGLPLPTPVSGSTGDILPSLNPTWRQYGLVFQTPPGQTSVILRMINEGDGGYGNDLAIDDIVFRSCGDGIALEDLSTNTSVSICSNQTPYGTVISAVPDNTVFSSHFYQWEQSSDGITWMDVTGATSSMLTVSGITGTTLFRAKVSESILNVNNSSCNTLSDVYEINVTPAIVTTFSQVASICAGDSLAPLPTNSNEGVSGTWNPALDNMNTTTYTFTPDSGQCASTQTMTITVNPLVTPTFTQVSAICNGDTLSPLPTTSNNSITGTWSPALDNTTTTTYTFTPDAVQCASTQIMTITVNPLVTPTFTQVPAICIGDTLSVLPTTSNNGVTGTWSPALDNTTTTTYTFTPDAGQCASTQTMTITVNTPVTPTFTQVPAICSGDTLSPLPTTSNNSIIGTWSPALDNTMTTTYTFTPDAGQCASTQTMTITVNPSVTPTFTQIPAICSGDILSPLPTTSNNSITGTWSPALDNTMTTTYTFTPDSGQCASTQTMTITVNPSVTPTFTQVPAICIGDTLSALPTTSNNGVAGTWSPGLDNTTTTTYTFTPNAGQCTTIQTMTITVNPSVTPTFTQVSAICSGDTLLALPTTSNNSITGAWSPALDNTMTTTYTFTPDPGQCATIQTMTITVNSSATPTFTQVQAICSGDTLSPLPTTSNNGVTGTWSPNLNNTMTTMYTFTPDVGFCPFPVTMMIEVNENPSFSLQDEYFLCFDIDGTLVTPKTLNTGLNTADYNFTWLLNGVVISGANQGSYNPIEEGRYEVIVQNSMTLCETRMLTDVVALYEPDFEANVITDAFSENQTIEVTVLNIGDYEYQLDGGTWQDTPIFSNVTLGEHVVTARDKRGCIEASETIVVMDYPKYFTPNGDGFHDTWNITAPRNPLDYLALSKVRIFDRYGKLLKEIDPTGDGWNGIYNGSLMNTDDYWFVVEYIEPRTGESKTFRSNFTLKR